MRHYVFLFLFLFALSAQGQGWKTDEQYIQKFAQFAVEEMEKYQIPASITLAQGLLETGGGQSRLAIEGNNHFGIKCKEEWTGKTMTHTDDAPNECFRVYNDPRESYEDHSKFLRFRKYYQDLFKLDPTDYKAWAHGLKKAGYATNPRYAYILIDRIEKHRLYEFDRTDSNKVLFTLLKMYPALSSDQVFMAKVDQNRQKTEPVTVSVPYQQVSYAKQMENVDRIKSREELLTTILIKSHPNGGKKYIIVPADTDLDFIATKFGVSVRSLKKWNDLDNTSVSKNDLVFLESKSSSAKANTYKTRAGESMHDISQKLGIKLSTLYSKNRMRQGEQPTPGQVLYLHQKRPRG